MSSHPGRSRNLVHCAEAREERHSYGCMYVDTHCTCYHTWQPCKTPKPCEPFSKICTPPSQALCPRLTFICGTLQGSIYAQLHTVFITSLPRTLHRFTCSTVYLGHRPHTHPADCPTTHVLYLAIAMLRYHFETNTTPTLFLAMRKYVPLVGQIESASDNFIWNPVPRP